MTFIITTRYQNPLLLWFPQEYINKYWRGCWKGTNVNSITTATIKINVNLQQSIKIAKKFSMSQKTRNALSPLRFFINWDSLRATWTSTTSTDHFFFCFPQCLCFLNRMGKNSNFTAKRRPPENDFWQFLNAKMSFLNS